MDYVHYACRYNEKAGAYVERFDLQDVLFNFYCLNSLTGKNENLMIFSSNFRHKKTDI